MQKKRRRSAGGTEVVDFRIDSILRVNSPYARTYPDAPLTSPSQSGPDSESESENRQEPRLEQKSEQNNEPNKKQKPASKSERKLARTEQLESTPESRAVKQPRLGSSVTPSSKASSTAKPTRSYHVHKSGVLFNTSYAVVQLRAFSDFALNGSAWISVLGGSCDVFGATLGPTSPPGLIISAPIAPYSVRLTSGTEGTEGTKLQKGTHPDIDVHLKLRDAVLQKFTPQKNRCTMLLTQPASDLNSWKAGGCSDLIYSLQPYMREMGLPSVEEGVKLLRNVTVVEKGNVFQEWEAWGSLKAELDRSLEANENVRILVCGGSGTGKSTLVRCVCNYLICKKGGVVLVDTDVGQPEMNIPGTVAAYELRELRLGAAGGRAVPFCGRFLGETTAREEPDLYAQYVETVVSVARNAAEKSELPMVVNSDGWVNGVGAQLLDHLGRCVIPTHLAETRVGGIEKGGLNAVREGVEKVFVMDAPWEGKDRVFTGGVQRDMLIAGYFAGELGIGRVYKVSMRDVKVVWCGESPMEESSVLSRKLNACLVGLGKIDSECCDVKGFGIVRGVGVTEGELYVCTPVPKKVLEDCDRILVSGGVQVPHSVFVSCAKEWIRRSGSAPYVMGGGVGTGESMRSRGTLQRR